MVAVTSNITIGGLKMKQHPSNKRILRDFIDFLKMITDVQVGD